MYIEDIKHVYPINDIKDHLLETVTSVNGVPYCKCSCQATNIVDGSILIIKHNSFDGREAFEINNPARLN